ncbi:FAD-binding oxidoreductase [Streptomyces sp. NPDC020681]|uniref:FAD-binding oxidoreductase n=1 Tax=Streptomyces sp. NPDC020681 TaxID=3365083 RepID=UPI0037AE1671
MLEGNVSTQFADFPTDFKGPVLRPDDEGYAEVREIPNTRWSDRRPSLIARATDTDDVVTAVRYAVGKDVKIAVRSGGHAIDGHAMPHDAFVIDTSLMKRTDCDPQTGVTTIQAGVLLGEMDRTTQEHGYVVPAGTVSKTGAAGLTLGGGIGYLSRRFGATVDHLLSCEVVTMDGRRLTCSEDQNQELFWGLRGAGHNLALATSFTYQARRVGPRVMSGLITYPIEEAVPILARIDEALADSPRELTIYPVLLPAPPLPGLPPEMINVPIFVLIVVYTGELDSYEAAMARVRALGRPLADMVRPSSWLEANSILDVLAPPGRRQWSRGGYLGGVDERIGRVVVDRVMDRPAPTGPGASCAVAFQLLGGAMFDYQEDSKAFSRTGAEWLWETLGQWDPAEKDSEYQGWVDGTMNAVNPFSLPNGYVNLSTDRGAEWLRGVYGSEDKWRRIVALKREWDPDNRLSHNKNVTRASEEATR